MATEWCATCCNLDSNGPRTVGYGRNDEDERGFFIHTSVGDIHSSSTSAKACRYCSVLYTVLGTFWTEPVAGAKVILCLWRGCTPNLFLPSYGYSRVELYSPEDTPRAWKALPIRREISKTGGSEAALAFLKTRLRMCVDNHSMCAQQPLSPPRRLLQLLDNGASAMLVEFEANTYNTERLRYVALSYCWGNDQPPLQVVTANLELLKCGFSTAQLPRCLNDAIHVALHCGVSYMWIDALCIIQDDKADWRREAAKMKDIYEGAYFTIAAASSASISISFLDSRREEKSVNFQTTTDEGAAGAVVAARFECESGHHHQEQDPWDLRAWTLQEQVLSTRLIVFSKDEVQWSCKSCHDCECKKVEPYVDQRLLFEPDLDQQPQKLRRLWNELVRRYTRRHLTRSQDKLIALSGVAETVQRITNSQYISGLWESNLVADLYWSRVGLWHPDEPAWTLPAGYTAPTFSWASVQGYVRPLTGIEEDSSWHEDTKLVDFRTDLTGSNPYGAVTDAFIVLQGRLIPTSLSLDSATDGDGYHKYLVDISGYKHLITHDVEIDAVLLQQPTETKLFAARSSSHHFVGMGTAIGVTYSRSPLREIGVACEARLLYLGHEIWDDLTGNGRQLFLVLGLSLRRSGAFERLGLLYLLHQCWENWHPPFNDDYIQEVVII